MSALGRVQGSGQGAKQPQEIEVYRGTNRVPPIDAKVTKIEDTAAAGSLSLQGIASIDAQAVRPDYGIASRTQPNDPIIAWSNYFRLTTEKPPRFHLYTVKVSHDDFKKEANICKKKRERLIEQWMEHTSTSRSSIVTDWRSCLYSFQDIAQDKLQITITYKQKLHDDSPKKPQNFIVTLTKGKEDLPGEVIAVAPLLDDLGKPTPVPRCKNPQEVITPVNMTIAQFARYNDGFCLVGGRRCFMLHSEFNVEKYKGFFKDIKGCLEVIRGFFASVRPAPSGLVLNVNVTVAAFHKIQKLDTLMEEFGNAYGYSIQDQKEGSKHLQAFLKGLRIKVTHLKTRANNSGKENPFERTIIGLAHDEDGKGLQHRPKLPKGFAFGPSEIEFWKLGNGVQLDPDAKDRTDGIGSHIIMSRYYKNNYPSVTLGDRPVVNVGTIKDPEYFPAEVCEVLPGQYFKGWLTEDQVKEIAPFARQKPRVIAAHISQYAHDLLGLSNDLNPALTGSEFSVEQEMITLPGRMLANPLTEYRNGQDTISNGSWTLSSERKFLSCQANLAWACLNMRLEEDRNSIIDPASEFVRQWYQYGLNLGARRGFEASHLDGRDKKVQNDVIESIISLKSFQGVKVLLVILPIDSSEARRAYNQVKRLCDGQKGIDDNGGIGIQSVCVHAEKFFKKNVHYLANVALKANIKLNGTNHTIKDQGLDFVERGTTMIVGIDVTHPGARSKDNAPSIAAVVATIDQHLAQWPAELRLQRASKKEMVFDLYSMIRSRRNLWQSTDKNKKYPANILIYRDGVSEGQYKEVLNYELTQIDEACKDAYKMAKQGLPKVTYIVVGKRHHTRFFPTAKDDKTVHETSNFQSGLVVDWSITDFRGFDFFLQSHNAILGTARPAHYVVLRNEIPRLQNKLSGAHIADRVQKLTYNLCHMCPRATTAVSVCPPVYLADLACERARRLMPDDTWEPRELWDPPYKSNKPGDHDDGKPDSKKLDDKKTDHGKPEQKPVTSDNVGEIPKQLDSSLKLKPYVAAQTTVQPADMPGPSAQPSLGQGAAAPPSTKTTPGAGGSSAQKAKVSGTTKAMKAPEEDDKDRPPSEDEDYAHEWHPDMVVKPNWSLEKIHRHEKLWANIKKTCKDNQKKAPKAKPGSAAKTPVKAPTGAGAPPKTAASSSAWGASSTATMSEGPPVPPQGTTTTAQPEIGGGGGAPAATTGQAAATGTRVPQ